MAFYERFYTPQNAILVVAGDVTGPDVKKMAAKYYGGIEGRPVPERPELQEPPQLAPRRVTLTSDKVGRPLWRRSYLAPSAVTGDISRSIALEVLAQYLGGGTLSRLYQSLVVDQEMAASTGAYYSAVQRDKTTFGLYAVPAPGTDLDSVETAVEKEIAAVAEGDIDPADIERTKTLLKADTVYSRDSLMQMAITYGQALSAGLPADYVRTWPERVDAVTPEDVAAAAKAVLKPEASVTGRLLPVASGGGLSESAAMEDGGGKAE
jgi:zinc protease